MRVLMTTDTVGGVWTFTNELSEELLRRGHAVHAVSFGREPSRQQAAVFTEKQGRFPDRFSFIFSPIPLEWMQENERTAPEGKALLATEVGAFAPDLILSSQFCFGSLDVKVPKVVVAHSDVLSWAAACKPSALEASPWLNRYTSLVQSGLLSASAVVAPTQWMVRALVRNFFLANGATVLPNGRDVQTVVGVERKMQAVTVGRLWDEAKGLDLFADLELPIPLVVAGEASFDGASVPVNMPSVTWLGALAEPEMLATMAQSAVYVCSSRYEPFGLAPLEAALCGCALVLRDLPSLREVWGEAAAYFTDGEDLRGVLKKLTESPELLAELQRRAAIRAGHYTVARMTDAYLQIFEALLGRSVAVPYVA